MRLKVHGIAYQLAQPRTAVIDAAHDLEQIAIALMASLPLDDSPVV